MNDVIPTEDSDDVKRSFGRCLLYQVKDKKFLDRFYEIFISSHSAIKPIFEKTEFKTQVAALKNGINMAILHAKGDSLAADVLSKIRKSHNRHYLNINPEFYPYWVNSLIQVIKESDPQFNDSLEKKWRSVLQFTVDYIKAGY